MLEKEAFDLLKERVWHMLQSNEPVCNPNEPLLELQPPQSFRESVARRVIEEMGQTLFRKMQVESSETGAQFIDAVAFNFTYIIVDKRPVRYESYTELQMAEMLIGAFCISYIEIRGLFAACMPFDSPLGWYTPSDGLRGEQLRARVRTMEPTTFGRFTLPV